MKAKPLKSNTKSEKLEVYSLSAHVTWLLFTNKHSILMIDIYLQTFRSFQPTFRFHLPFLTFKARIIRAQQIEQSWCLETYKLVAPAQKQLAHPLFSSYSDTLERMEVYIFWHGGEVCQKKKKWADGFYWWSLIKKLGISDCFKLHC